MKAKEGKVISLGSSYNAALERNENVIGSRIAAARKRRGWNLGVLTDTLKGYGVELSKAAVNKWETGETVPNALSYTFVIPWAAMGRTSRPDRVGFNISVQDDDGGGRRDHALYWVGDP